LSFPRERPRRLRGSPGLRDLVRQTRLGVDDLIYPLFVVPGEGVCEEIATLPGQHHRSVDRLAEEVGAARSEGIRAVLLFGLPERKDPVGSEASDPEGAVQRAVRELKERFPDLVVITDVCLCEYTSHGHCGILDGERVDNDATLGRLAQVAISHAGAGADLVAPSDMMDGRVGAIRAALDQAGLDGTGILSYAVKYASVFYDPFREAARSAPAFGDRRGYQMDPGNLREALREVRLDLEEGADMVMVKPGLAYLDVLAAVRRVAEVPLVAYNVSGEYAMVRAAAERGWLREREAVLEILTGMRRAGADLILTYHARQAARWLGGA
jgi:porphobilinogen synthase